VGTRLRVPAVRYDKPFLRPETGIAGMGLEKRVRNA